MPVTTVVSTAVDSANTASDRVTVNNSGRNDYLTFDAKISGTISAVLQGQSEISASNWADVWAFSDSDANGADMVWKQVAYFPFYRVAYVSGGGEVSSARITTNSNY